MAELSFAQRPKKAHKTSDNLRNEHSVVEEASHKLGVRADALQHTLAASREHGFETQLRKRTWAHSLQMHAQLEQPGADRWLPLVGISPAGMNRRFTMHLQLQARLPLNTHDRECTVTVAEHLPSVLYADSFEMRRLASAGSTFFQSPLSCNV